MGGRAVTIGPVISDRGVVLAQNRAPMLLAGDHTVITGYRIGRLTMDCETLVTPIWASNCWC
jgi:hypothetical protein